MRAARERIADHVGLSMMTGFIVGTTEEQVEERRAKIRDFMGDAGDGTWLIGTPDVVIEQIKVLQEAGLDRIMLQHHLFGDDDHVKLIAEEVLPAL